MYFLDPVWNIECGYGTTLESFPFCSQVLFWNVETDDDDDADVGVAVVIHVDSDTFAFSPYLCCQIRHPVLAYPRECRGLFGCRVVGAIWQLTILWLVLHGATY